MKHRRNKLMKIGDAIRYQIGGFTLVELLVVIAIISLLLALILVGIHITREKAIQAQCLHTLYSEYLALLLYTENNDGLCPIVTDLENVALKMQQALGSFGSSKEACCCPKDPNKPIPPGGSYDWRVTGNPETSISGVRLALLRYPSRVIIAGERRTGWHKSGKINVLFADGHVDQVTEEFWFENITTPLQFI